MRLLSSILVLTTATAPALLAQQIPTVPAPTIDTIIIVRHNVFGEGEAQANAGFRVANAIHFKTREGVVRRELLFRAGEAYDSALVAETERNLRSLGIFREVVIDSVRLNGRFAVLVSTADGWTSQVALNAGSTGNTLTWLVGLTELNFLGTGNAASISYRNGVDRNALTLGTRFNRPFGTRLFTSGFYEDLSDGRRGGWLIGSPFRAFSDRRALDFVGDVADHRVLRFRTPSDSTLVTEFQRRVFLNRASGAVALLAESGRYVRVGGAVQVRGEEIFPRADPLPSVPDSVTGAVGVFAEYRRAGFKVVTHFNGFGRREDLDLSTVVRLSMWVAPSSFGYQRTGIGPEAIVQVATSIPSGFARLVAVANGLITNAGVDSGRVAAALTVGTQLMRRQATFVHVEAGLLKGQAPGREFDLGHGLGPRTFGPHAFTGNRSVWGTLEHRLFLVDNMFGLMGLGFATFLDYGGAWYDGDERRFGGDVGLGIRTGMSRATGNNIGRFDVGYQFGDGRTGGRWVTSFGRGFAF